MLPMVGSCKYVSLNCTFLACVYRKNVCSWGPFPEVGVGHQGFRGFAALFVLSCFGLMIEAPCVWGYGSLWHWVSVRAPGAFCLPESYIMMSMKEIEFI